MQEEKKDDVVGTPVMVEQRDSGEMVIRQHSMVKMEDSVAKLRAVCNEIEQHKIPMFSLTWLTREEDGTISSCNFTAGDPDLPPLIIQFLLAAATEATAHMVRAVIDKVQAAKEEADKRAETAKGMMMDILKKAMSDKDKQN